MPHMPRSGKSRHAASVDSEAEPARPQGEDLYATLGAPLLLLARRRLGAFSAARSGSLTRQRFAAPAVTGLPRDASAEDIKRAYKLLALRHHPDKAGEDAAAVQVFQRVSFAYSVLSDARKKRYYDDTGALGIETAALQHPVLTAWSRRRHRGDRSLSSGVHGDVQGSDGRDAGRPKCAGAFTQPQTASVAARQWLI